MPFSSLNRWPARDRASGDGAARRTWWARGLIATAVFFLGLGGFWSIARGRDDSLARGRAAGVFSVGYAMEAPYAFADTSGVLTGESPEIARRIAERLGVRVEWRLTEFGALIEELEAGSFDVIAAGMFVTRERRERVAFSRPTFEVEAGLLVRRGNPLGLRDAARLKRMPEPRLAVLSGSVEAAAFSGPNVVRVPDAEAGLALLKAGRVDAFRLSRPAVRWLAAREETVESVEPFDPGTGGPEGRVAFAFRRGDTALRAEWDRQLDEFMGGSEYREIAARFGFDPLATGGGGATR